jgi:excisionase family DNA binding protein
MHNVVAAPPKPPRFISLRTVANELGISWRTVRKLVAEGELPAVRIGGVLRVPRSAMEEFLLENRLPAPQKEEMIGRAG